MEHKEYSNAERIARADRLEQLTGLAGWQDVLDFMEQRLKTVEMKLINCSSSDPQYVFALQRFHRGMRELFDYTQSDIAAAIEEGKDLRKEKQLDGRIDEGDVYGTV